MAEGVETSLNEMPSENLPRGEHTVNVGNGLRLDKVPRHGKDRVLNNEVTACVRRTNAECRPLTKPTLNARRHVSKGEGAAELGRSPDALSHSGVRAKEDAKVTQRVSSKGDVG